MQEGQKRLKKYWGISLFANVGANQVMFQVLFPEPVPDLNAAPRLSTTFFVDQVPQKDVRQAYIISDQEPQPSFNRTTDEKCKSAVLTSGHQTSEMEVVILDTDDGWDTFVFDNESRRWEEEFLNAETKAGSEDDAKRLVVRNALKLRGEPVSGGQLNARVEEYLTKIEWLDGYPRARLPINCS